MKLHINYIFDKVETDIRKMKIWYIFAIMNRITPNMKYALILILIVPMWASAQSDTLKAKARNFATELNVNPFQGNLSLNNALQQIKVRYFIKEQLALRVAFNASSKKSNNDASNPYGSFPIKVKNERKSFLSGINVGLEKHFSGTKRLSPYIGGEINFAVKNSSQKMTNGTTETDVKGAWMLPSYGGGYEERGFVKYGISGVCGFDYYFAKNFYFGYEFAFQISKTKFKDIDVTYKGSGVPTPATPATNYDDRETVIGPSLLNGIRLGFIF